VQPSENITTLSPSPGLARAIWWRSSTGKCPDQYRRANSTLRYGGSVDRACAQNSSATNMNALNETTREPTGLARFSTRKICIAPFESNARHIFGKRRLLVFAYAMG